MTQSNVCPYCFEKERQIASLKKALIAAEAVSQERRAERDALEPLRNAIACTPR